MVQFNSIYFFNLQICPVYFLSLCTINIQTGKIANNLVIWEQLFLSISWSLIDIDVKFQTIYQYLIKKKNENCTRFLKIKTITTFIAMHESGYASFLIHSIKLIFLKPALWIVGLNKTPKTPTLHQEGSCAVCLKGLGIH